MDANVQLSSNWTRSGGCIDLSAAIETKISQEDIFIKPDLNEILSEEHAMLLVSPPDSPCSCELQMCVFPRYKIEAIHIVCSASKMELFVGKLKTYLETVHGSIIVDDENEALDTMPKTYRYDIEVDKSGVVEITMKLFTSDNEICLYGMLLIVAPNPNGITTMMPGAINMENVQQILEGSQQKLSPSAEKCKLFMQRCTKNATTSGVSQAILEEMKMAIAAQGHTSHSQQLPQKRNISSVCNVDATGQPCTLDIILKTHIDMRMKELETKIIGRLDDIAIKQSMKLDCILQAFKGSQK